MVRRLLRNQTGFTLIELIVAMVVISIALSGVLMVMNYTTQKSADPVLRHQAIAIAEAYMEEISLKSFVDPDGLPEVGRANFDDVSDYNSLPDTVVRDQTGTAIAGLGSYSVAVVVDAQNFGATGNQESGLRIRVTVTDPAGEALTLTGYRANY